MAEGLEKTSEKMWDIKAALKKWDEYEDAPRRSCRGLYVYNMMKVVPKIFKYVMDNSDQYDDEASNAKTIFCIYSIYRSFNGRKAAIKYIIGINHKFAVPLSNDTIFGIIDRVENEKSYMFGHEKIMEFCGINDPEPYRIGVNVIRRKRSEARKLQKEEDEVIKRQIISTIEEMSCDYKMTYDRMLDELHSKGFKIGKTKLKELMKTEGINWRTRKKELKFGEPDYERD